MSEFKSEIYLKYFLSHPGHIQYSNINASGGNISREVKVVITLRLITGDDEMNLGSIFDISSN